MENIKKNYLNLIGEISKSQTKLIVVSKTRTAEEIECLYKLGQRHFGENRVQELFEKSIQLKDRCPDIQWHMIGHLQSNKINQLFKITNLFAIHSVDSLSLLKELLKKTPLKKIKLFLEIKTSNEDEKHGMTDLSELSVAMKLVQDHENFELAGVMTMAPIRSDAILEDARVCFRKLVQIKNQLNPNLELSMGMSGDYAIAMEEGANWIRVGSKVFQ